MQQDNIWEMALNYMLLAAISVGGLGSVIPEIQRYVVEQNGWFTARQFGEIFALSQVIPGPNVLIVTMLGWLVSSWQGAIVVTIALFTPGSIISALFIRAGANNPDSRGAQSVRKGLAPVVIGLSMSTAWIMFTTISEDWRGVVLMLLTVVLVLRTKINPLWLIGAGAGLGMLGVV
ncbi:MAG: chromate transporter [Betaproteobacteria bacterium]|nr:chromate transporter [Betaproteobacteria bacterium]